MSYLQIDDTMQRKLDNIDLLTLLESRGYQLRRTGHQSYNVVLDGEISSLAIFYSREANAWRWKRHSQNVGGGAIALISHLEGLPWKEAVESLLGMEGMVIGERPVVSVPKPQENHPTTFLLPNKNRHCQNGKPPYSRLFGYLCNRRGIDRDIVRDMIEKKLLYLSHEKLLKNQEVFNCVFVGYDEAGEARWAAKRGTTDKSFSGTVAESDPQYAFALKGSTNTIRVFEAPIDLLSYLTMCKIKGVACNDHMVALGGLFDHGLEKQLSLHHQIKRIIFCFDNDITGTKTAMDSSGFQKRILWNHGQKAAEEYCRKYEAMGYDCRIHTPKEGKDWNDVLTFYRQMEAGLEAEEELDTALE